MNHPQLHSLNLTKFLSDYLATAAWVTCDSGENQTFNSHSKRIAIVDCSTFIDKVITEFGKEEAERILTTPASADLHYSAPHDFFLTRNHHGAGFWDRKDLYGGEEINDRLTKICEDMGQVDVYHVRGPKSKLTF